MKSRGALEFRTKPSDFGRMGGKIRLLNEQGRIHELPLGVSETMVATNASYTEEMFEISRRIFGSTTCARWDRNYILYQDVCVSDLSLSRMKDMYHTVKGAKVDIASYVAVARRFVDYDSIVSYAQRIFMASGCNSVPAWTFLFDDDDKVLYVRRFFLESFKRGLDILNVIRMQEKVREHNEKKHAERRIIKARRYNRWL